MAGLAGTCIEHQYWQSSHLAAGSIKEDEMSNIVLFEEKQVRRVWHAKKWYFVVSDVVQILTDSANIIDYLKKLRRRDPSLAEGWGQIVTPLLVETPGGRQKLNCADAEGLLRIIQSIPSPKAEPFKRWLAR